MIGAVDEAKEKGKAGLPPDPAKSESTTAAAVDTDEP
jgi:hypothetical protein